MSILISIDISKLTDSSNSLMTRGGGGWLISLWFYKENNKLWDWKKCIYSTYYPLSSAHFFFFLFILTANGFLPGDSDNTIRHNTQITHITQNNTTIKRNTEHKTTHTIKDTLHRMNTNNHHYTWLRCSNFFNPSMKNYFGCAANREIGKSKDLSAPLLNVTIYVIVWWWRSHKNILDK
jgi:hypothetical protein